MATDTREAAPRAKPPARAGGRRRTSPLRFYREVVAELRKVVYPSRTELITYVVVVLVFVSVMTAIVASLDFGLTKLVLLVFG
ncbi:preprotein translocase subunit SecE [Frankia sp. CNm7]|uniref:Protein translocase subunit SecE n=1 Tax=Frankia nepalensis TaxID=1836974 RepID=A0A937RIB1_9ACTN|nr:preprotein translocase subunit SecE [Frankia nepalensis]MBL7496098.1 preprotein translocase subunit SecE [Frankia nepalensis]MBL7511113.1 preprotein translocase subunit SecE [Frankia nepalensis]MBL7522980.1 preprotein translocase subunit SecE [Frankia nepalensis]MBL7630702.1 preprotein translocase subunit SecE [Frankia nepalensis]